MKKKPGSSEEGHELSREEVFTFIQEFIIALNSLPQFAEALQHRYWQRDRINPSNPRQVRFYVGTGELCIVDHSIDGNDVTFNFSIDTKTNDHTIEEDLTLSTGQRGSGPSIQYRNTATPLESNNSINAANRLLQKIREHAPKDQ